MELQLGLALPSNSINGFDLNNDVYEPKEMLGSETWSHDRCLGSKNNKRSFYEAFEKTKPVTQTLPLLSWNDQPNDEDDRKSFEKSSSYTTVDEEENGVVGWPPIKSWRKKIHQYQYGDNQRVGNGCDGSNSMHVKVTMEGVAIGRKVDLSLHQSYQMLRTTLIGMFGKYQKIVKGPKDGTGYTLTYQDKEGDWLLVGDVPWQTFIQTVQRLKILRSGGR